MGNAGDIPGETGHINPVPAVLVSLSDVQHQVLAEVELLTQRVANLDAKLDKLSAASAAHLDTNTENLRIQLIHLAQAIERNEHGVTLISLVQQIYDKVNSL